MPTALAAKPPAPRARRPGRIHAESALRILSEPFAFIDSPIFRQRGIEARLMDFDVQTPLPPVAWYHPTTQEFAPSEATNSPKLMKAGEEKSMFHCYNYAKKRLAGIQNQVRRHGLTAQLAEQLTHWHRCYEHLREYLVRTNLSLVLAMARRNWLGQVDFADMVSEGNMALLRAVDKFDADRGFKFSTYACRAILKAFSREKSKSLRHRTRFPVQFDPDMEKSDWHDRCRETVNDECVDELKNVVEHNIADLTSVEQTVIRCRFNLKERSRSPLTLEEVGKIIGLTKERVRQIQNKALAKIRQVIEEGIRPKPPLQPQRVAAPCLQRIDRIEAASREEGSF